MKPKEAIMTLTKLKDKTDSYGWKCIDVAIDALEKQMPKKPNNLEPDEVMLYTGPDWAKCPSCGAIFTRKVAYCSICGQAIDWSDKE